MLNYRKIETADDEKIAVIIRSNLEKFHLNIPGTVYFDPELDRLSDYYNSKPDKRVYFIVTDTDGNIGAGWARTAGYKNLYLETHTNLSVAIKLYEKTGFHRIEKPRIVQHGTMNCFYLKEL